MPKTACVTGSGFAGLSAACHLAKAGFEVILLEKNDAPGGRARSFEEQGFKFDMGPSWYWMPDVFEGFFNAFDKQVSDYYKLIRLNPSYAVKFEDETINIPASMKDFEEMCESLEPGSTARLRRFLAQAKYKYEVGINDLVHKPSRSLSEFLDARLLYGLLRMDVFTSMRSHVRKFFKNDKLRQLMEFPILFLGATPSNTPALYSLMNYADISLGTWYPKGGMHEIVKGMVSLCEEMGVKMLTGQEVKSFTYENKTISRVHTDNDEFKADVVVASADYHHIDQKVLCPEFANYSTKYWDQRVMAPSSLLYYVGLDIELPKMLHHVLFFDEDFDEHAKEIYEHPKWPTAPLLYASVTSKTDDTVAPKGCENLFILIPVAPGLDDADEVRARYFEMAISKLEKYNDVNIRDHIVVKRSYAHKDFVSDYHSFRGNAYGLANTLRQTALLKPRLKNRKLKNLYFAGQLTVPGPGVPPSLISGEVAAKEIVKDFS